MGDREQPIAAGFAAPGEYVPSGEAQGVADHFSASDVAAAFGIKIERVHNALAGEFGSAEGAQIDSRQAPHLAEVLLVDTSQPEREAAPIATWRLHPALRSLLGHRRSCPLRKRATAWPKMMTTSASMDRRLAACLDTIACRVCQESPGHDFQC